MFFLETVEKIKSYKESHFADPTNNALLINFLLSSDAEIFVNEHQLSIQNRRRTSKNVYATCTTCSDRAFILQPPLVVGQEEWKYNTRN